MNCFLIVCLLIELWCDKNCFLIYIFGSDNTVEIAKSVKQSLSFSLSLSLSLSRRLWHDLITNIVQSYFYLVFYLFRKYRNAYYMLVNATSHLFNIVNGVLLYLCSNSQLEMFCAVLIRNL